MPKKFGVVGIALSLLVTGCGGGRGSGTDAAGNPIGLGLQIRKISGDNQAVKKNAMFADLVARVESPDGSPVPEMTINCWQKSATDAVITGPTQFYTNSSGIISTTVKAPSQYDEQVQIVCGIPNTPDQATFNLETRFFVDHIEFIPGMEPPAAHTVHHVTPLNTFQVRMIDTDGFVIDLSASTKHWIEISIVEPGNPGFRGTSTEYFTTGIAEFDDARYIKAGSLTLRAAHKTSTPYPSNKVVDWPMTFNPNAPTQSITKLPGQVHVPGVMTLVEAMTGTISSLNADNTFGVDLFATDDYFNVTSYAGPVSVATPQDLVDTEPAAGAFVAGNVSFTIDPVQAKTNHTITTTSGLALNNTSSVFTIVAGSPVNLIARLPSQVYDPGQLSLGNAVTGAPAVQVAGIPFNVQVVATDAEYNQTNTTPTTSLTTSDLADTNPANQALVSGTRNFSVDNRTAGTNHTVTPASAGYVSNSSGAYTVMHNVATQMVFTTTVPSTVVAGDEIAPVVEIRDAYGNIVNSGADATAYVTMSLYAGTGTLAGTVSTSAVAGVADFTGLGAYINLVGAKTLRLAKNNQTGVGGQPALTLDTGAFTILHAPAAEILWATQPPSVIGAGLTITAGLQIRDAYTNIVTTGVDATGAITLAIQDGTGTLWGTTGKNPAAGVVNFTSVEGLNITVTGAKTLRAFKADTSGAGGTAALFSDSGVITVIHGTATQLTWSTQPVDPTVAGTDILPVVEVQDTYGNAVNTGGDATSTITLSIFSGTGGATFSGTKVLSAVGGVATWTAVQSLDIDLVGTYILRATKSNQTASGGVGALIKNSTAFDIKHAPASQLVWTTQPTTPTVAGNNLLPVIQIQDPYGNIVTDDDDATAAITVSIASGTGTLWGTTSKLATAGVASFTAVEALNITVAGAKTLVAAKSDQTFGSGVGPLTRNSNAFVILHAPASQLVWTTQPADPTVAGSNLLPVVAIEDVYGNVVNTGADAGVTITLNLQSGSGTLVGTPTKAAVNGVADFTAANALRITVTGAKTLRASKPSTVGAGGTAALNQDSDPFTIKNSPATQLIWATQPTNPTIAGTDILPVIEIRDTHNNLVAWDQDATAQVTLSLFAGTGTLWGTVAKQATGGVVNFTAAEAVNITIAGAKTLRATKADLSASGGVAALLQNSNAFVVRHAPATQLTWTTQPTDPTVAGTNMLPVIEIQDPYGNVANTGGDATAVITLSLQTGSGTLNGTVAKQATNGVAAYLAANALQITVSGAKTLRATKSNQIASGGVGALVGDSNVFTINNSAATQLVWTTQPPNPSIAGDILLPVIEIRDTHNNIVTVGVDATAQVTLSLLSGAGTLWGTLAKQAASGVVSYTAPDAVSLTVTGAKTLRATKMNLVAGGGAGALVQNSQAFIVNNSPATTLVWTVQPTNPTAAGNNLLPTIQIRDTYGNVVTADDDATAAITVSLSAGTGTAWGTTTKLASAGVVSFTGVEAVNITVTGAKTLTAHKSDQTFGTGVGVLSFDSAAFIIGPAPASKLLWSTQPADPTVAGSDLLPVVQILDTYDNIVTNAPDSTANITLSVASGVGGATFSGTKTLPAVNGVATWTGVQSIDLDLVGTYTLSASKASTVGGGGVGILTQNSALFNIVHAPASQLTWSVQPTNPTVAGVDLTPTIQIKDAYNNIVTSGADATAAIALTIHSGTGPLYGTTTKLAASGVVSFTGVEAVNITIVGAKTLRATKSDQVFAGGTVTIGANSANFSIVHANANKLVYTVEPTDPTIAGSNILPTIEIRDVYENVITSGNDATALVTLSIASGTGTLNGTVAKQATAGSVSFLAAQAVNITVTGQKTLAATKSITGTTGAIAQNSQNFAIINNTATNLVWTTQPADQTPAGNDLLPVIEIRDTHNNLVTTGVDATALVTLTINTGTGTLDGTVAKQASGGIVSFLGADDLRMTVTGPKTLKATKSVTSASGSFNANSGTFTIANAPASNLVWTVQPTSPTAAGANILPTIQIRDTYANVVTSGVDATALISLALVDGTGTLDGTITKQASSGVVSFLAAQAVNITVSGGKTLAATKADLSGGGGTGAITAASNAFMINNAPASQLVWTVQPADPTVAGADITPTIQIRDTYGNLVTTGADATANLSLSIFLGTGSLNGTVSKLASGGIVSFGAAESVDIQVTGSKTLTATKSTTVPSGGVGILTANSNIFTIRNAPATQLVWTAQPTDPTIAGANITPTIQIRDTYNNLVTSDDDATAAITVSLSSGTGVLYGSLTKVASGGVVSYVGADAVNITISGNKILTAWKSDQTFGTGVGALSAASNTFEIRHNTPTHIVFSSEPPNPSTASIEIPMVVQIRDTYENVVYSGVDATAQIAITLDDGAGAMGGTTAINATAGVANFVGTGINVDTVGAKTLRATKMNLAGGGGTGAMTTVSQAFMVVPGVATQIVFQTEPATPTQAGADLLPRVEIRDIANNVVALGVDATAFIELSLFSGTGALNGTLTIPAVGGVAQFNAGHAVNMTVPGAKVIRAMKWDTTSGGSGTSAMTANSATFTITNANASQLVWNTHPVNPTIAGADIMPVVEIQDVYGNIVNTTADATANVTMSILLGTGTLDGTVTKQASAGVVSFLNADDMNITVTGAKTLTATKTMTAVTGAISANSNGFTINNSTATNLVWTSQPSDPTVAGINLLPVIQIRDAYANLVTTGVDATALVTLSLQTGTGTLYGTVAKQASGGVVSYLAAQAVNITVTGAKTLRATKSLTSGSGSFNADSASFVINNAAANYLTWQVQPTSPTVAGVDLTPTIYIRDVYGNVVTTSADATAAVTLAIQSGTGGASLGGTTVKQATAGTVAWTGVEALDIDLVGTYTLSATKADLSGGGASGSFAANSAAFNITHAPAALVVWSAQPADPTAAGANLLPVIQIQDAFSNIVTSGSDATALVTLSLQAGTGTLDGTVAKQATNGVVSFLAAQAVNITVTGAKTLRATKSLTSSTGSLNNDSNPFTIINNTATNLVWTTQPGNNTQAGADLLPVVEIRDTYGNVVTTGSDATALLTLSLLTGTGTLDGTVAKQAAAGVVPYLAAEAVNITVTGAKTLRATKSLTSASASFNASSGAFTILNAAANNLLWASQPASPTAAGANLLPVIHIRDTYGNIVTTTADATAAIALSLTTGTGTLDGTITKQASSGIVSFLAAEAVNITVSGAKQLTATKADLSGGGAVGALNQTSGAFTIINNTATNLVWTVQPTDPTVAGANLTPTVQIRDTYGNVVDTGVDATALVTLTLQTGTGTLYGTVAKQASAGVVPYLAAQAVNITVTGAKTLRATKSLTSGSASFNADSNSFVISPAPATNLVWTTQPQNNTAAGANLTPVIEIRDTFNNVVLSGADATALVTLNLQTGTGTLDGTVAKQAASGIVSFTAAETVNITVTGAKTLRGTKSATSGSGSLNADSGAFTILNNTATQLAWSVQPTDPTIAGANITPTVQILDTYGNIVTSGVDATALVTLSLQTGTGTLDGTVAKQAASGVVPYLAAQAVNITVTGAKTLRATKSLTSGSASFNADSASFVINNSPATTLVWTSQPTNNTPAGNDLTPTIEIRDTYGNVVTTGADATALMTLSLQTGTGTLDGTVAKQAASGIVSYLAAQAVNITVTGAKTLRVTKSVTSATGSLNADSGAFTILNNTATNLTWNTQPTDPTLAGANLLPVVAIRDTYGNIVTSGVDATALVTLSLQTGTGTLDGTVAKQASSGLVSYLAAEAVNITVTGAKTLRATKSLTSGSASFNADSASFVINNSPATNLVWTAQPTDPTPAGNNLLPTIEIRDTYGNLVTTSVDATALVTLTLQTGTGTLYGTVAKQASGGIVSYLAAQAVNITVTGAKTLRATKSLTSGSASFNADSNSFVISPAPATSLVWSVQPSSPIIADNDILPTIQIRDSFGNVVVSGVDATAAITLDLVSGAGPLNGTLTKQATAGVVAFGAGESVDITSTGAKTLRATKADLSGGGGAASFTANSGVFTIINNTATQVVWTAEPANDTAAGANLLPTLEIRDTYSNLVTTGSDATALITLSLQSGTGTLDGTVAKQASGGAVAYLAAQALNITVTGAKTLRATKSLTAASGALNADTGAFTIANSAATNLVWTVEPTNNTAAGANLTPTIQIRDAYANVVTSGVDATALVTLSLFNGTGTLDGTVAKQAASGVIPYLAAEAVNITVTGAKTLRATKSLTSGSASFNANSGAFTIINNTATQLAWSVQPTDPTLAGANLTPTIQILDTYGNIVTSGVDATALVTLSLQTGTGTLDGTVAKQAAAGVVPYLAAQAVNITVTGAKTLRATKSLTSGSASFNADSASFVINNSPATNLVWSVQPTDPTLAGANLLPTIQIRDTYGNVVTTGVDATALVTLSLQTGTGTLDGTVAKQATNGVVAFLAAQAVNITVTGAKTLRATKSLTSGSASFNADSNFFTINNAAASQLVWTTQPLDPTQAGNDLVPVVEIRDTYGNRVTTSADATALITLAIASGPGGATLGGTKVKQAAAGIATWTGAEAMDLDLTGTYTLSAAKADLSPGAAGPLSQNSASFVISPAAATSLVWTVQPTDPTAAGANITPTIEIRDALNNVVITGPDSTALITLNLQTGTGTLDGTISKLAVAGVVSFGVAEAVNITITGAKTLRATKSNQVASGGVASFNADSNSFVISPSTATNLVWSAQPTNNTPAGFDLLPTVQIRDTYGNVVTTGTDATALVTLSLQTGTGILYGTVAKQATAGIIAYGAGDDVNITITGAKTLRATKSLTSGSASFNADSNAFTIINDTASTLVWTSQPTNNTPAGNDLLPVIEIRDTYGNVVTSGFDATALITLSLQSGTGTLDGTVAKQATSGVVQYLAAQAVNITVTGAKTLRATKSLTSGSASFNADSGAFTILNNTATNLVWSVQPTDPTPAGNDLLPTVQIQDTYGNIVTSGSDATALVTLTLQTGAGALYGTVAKQATSGVVSYLGADDVNITVTGAKTLRATKSLTSDSASFNADSASFVISPAPAASLTWAVQPTDPTVAGANITPTINILDTYGNIVSGGADATALVTLSLQTGAGAIYGSVAKQATAGVVAYVGADAVNITITGAKTLRATKSITSGSGVYTADSAAFVISPSTATTLVWTAEPANNSAAGADLLPTLEIRDTYGNVVTSGVDSTALVTLNLQTGTGTLDGTVAKQATSGAVAFLAAQAVNITVTGAKTLRATKSLTSGSASFNADTGAFTIINSPATNLVWTVEPTNLTAAGANLTPTIQIRDTYGNVVTSGVDATALVTLSLQTGTGTLDGTVAKQAAAGVVPYLAAQAVNITVTGAKTLRATKSLTSGSASFNADSGAFTIINNTATNLAWFVQPTDPTIAGADILPTIRILDTYGNIVDNGVDATALVTLSLQTGAGAIYGTVAKQAASGVVAYGGADDVNITVTGAKTLRATKSLTSGSASFNADSASFVISPSPATTLVWTAEPTNNTPAGNNLTPTIEIRDTYGNVVNSGSDATALVTLNLQTGSGTLDGTVAKQASAGVVSYLAAQAVNITVTGAKTLRATKSATSGSGSLNADSGAFTIINGIPTNLVWFTEPANQTQAGNDLLPVIHIKDAYGNIATQGVDATAQITLAIVSGPGGAVLGGTTSLQAVSGVTTWGAGDNLNLDLTGAFTLSATKMNLAGGGGAGALAANSGAFTIAPAAASTIEWSAQPTDPTTAGANILVTVRIKDTLGNVVTTGPDSTALITLSVQTGTGSVDGTASKLAVAGVASFGAGEAANITITGAKTLRATKSNQVASGGVGVLTGDSNSFNIVNSAATNLVWTVEPTNNTAAGANLTPTIQIRDTYLNLVTTGVDATALVTLSLQSGSGTLDGTVAKQASGGIIPYLAAQAVNITVTGAKTLRATKSATSGSGSFNADSGAFTILNNTATQLAWSVQPTDPTLAGADLTPTIQILDTYGNIVTSGVDATALVTLSLQTGTGAIYGTVAKQAASGVVPYLAAQAVNITVTGAKTLRATKSLTSGSASFNADSAAFTINPATATTLVWTARGIL